ncbi:hypothetical protein GJW-30_1_03671 [Variibacter gotjawalensis]|uniref:DUF2157 domain-containing protein n=1 Tax=Variibacter gotjawalensis TaxID=1333996 RepID=A0A0S3PYZ1_9BRAD|nr:DUF2157 domain-containing protein [Variibacter gotjawalensis]NIK46952.1 putative membrane protein [Variibacter gotjawalensis]RZS48856.1 putative membrane protein [Variibacter gotjawalensis]BAT61115.1 hypothetical protein GJW-30_1_03671 [Variibacter gotjawalensis]
MFETKYRQRLDQDLTRWEADGTVVPGTRASIQSALGPMPKGVDLTTAVAIVGGLLIAAAFLAFVAANWEGIARPARFAILVAGVVASYGLGAFFASNDRPLLADLGATVGSIVFGAAIALTGQMYHLGEDFAGGMLLWAIGALFAAIVTQSRGALAVSLVAASIWSGGRAFDDIVPHFPFIALWLVGVALSIIWNSPPARHLVAVAAMAWWGTTVFGTAEFLGNGNYNPSFAYANGSAFMLGAGLMLGLSPRVEALGRTFANYAAFGFAIALAFAIAGAPGTQSPTVVGWEMICGALGILGALVAAVIAKRSGHGLAAVALVLGVLAMAVYARPNDNVEPWFSYALALASMLAMVVSGMLDDERPRVVAGWLGLAALIAIITWTVKGSLLRRSLFLAIAGGAAIALAVLLGRWMPKVKEAA